MGKPILTAAALRRSWTLAAMLAAFAGCGGGGGPRDGGVLDGGGDGAACPTGGAGYVVIAVQGLPAGITPQVQLLGNNLSDSLVLVDGAPVHPDAGPGFVISWQRVRLEPAGGSIVGKVLSPRTVDFDGCVRADTTTTVTLDYVEEPGGEKLWVTAVNPPTLGRVFAGFRGTDIATTGAKTPVVWKSGNVTGRGGNGAFDHRGNFWLPAGDRINMYPMSTLGTSSDAPPAVTLTQPTTASANFAAFDLYGNLWISRGAPRSDHTVVAYAPAQLRASGAPTPSVVISSSDISNPTGLAFDGDGNLWVADTGNDKVLKFTQARLAASYAGPADVAILTKTAPTAPVSNFRYTEPNPLAFDRTGNLWVGYIGSIVKLTVAQQAATADIAGVFAIDVPGGTGAFAFDESGGLWLAGGPGGGAKFQRLPASALATAGDATPDIVIDSAELGGAESIVLNPAPTWSLVNAGFF